MIKLSFMAVIVLLFSSCAGRESIPQGAFHLIKYRDYYLLDRVVQELGSEYNREYVSVQKNYYHKIFGPCLVTEYLSYPEKDVNVLKCSWQKKDGIVVVFFASPNGRWQSIGGVRLDKRKKNKRQTISLVIYMTVA